MTVQVPLRLTSGDVQALDKLVAGGRYASRSDVLRAGLAHVLREERERAVDDAYRRGYERHPQEAWVGEVGLAGLAALNRAEPGRTL